MTENNLLTEILTDVRSIDRKVSGLEIRMDHLGTKVEHLTTRFNQLEKKVEHRFFMER